MSENVLFAWEKTNIILENWAYDWDSSLNLDVKNHLLKFNDLKITIKINQNNNNNNNKQS